MSRITIDPKPTYSLSPNLYMQFMEPLGTTDSSVEAGWDHLNNDWRPDLINATKELAPPLIRFGGCLSSYYRWKEGVGPRSNRVPMKNLLWGGIESNQVGTHEFVDFCNRVKAKPFYCVNFEADGRKRWARPGDGTVRSAGPAEAAAWVDYCNNPDNKLRKKHGHKDPYDLDLWQIGNETSYDVKGFGRDTAIKKTVQFAKAMRKKDPSLKLIGWGDSGWAPEMVKRAGEHLDYIAFHNMFSAGGWNPDSPLKHDRFRTDPAGAWEHLMNAWKEPEEKLRRLRSETDGSGIPLALTECHFALHGRNRNEILSTWAAGVANARILNVHQRHGDVLKIATLADFCGNRWLVNAVMIPTPGGRTFMLPVARVMALYRKYSGSKAVNVTKVPAGLDVVASRRGKKVYVHAVNTDRTRSKKVTFDITGLNAKCARAHVIDAPPYVEVDEYNADVLKPVEQKIPKSLEWRVPAGSVSAVEIVLI